MSAGEGPVWLKLVWLYIFIFQNIFSPEKYFSATFALFCFSNYDVRFWKISFAFLLDKPLRKRTTPNG